MSSDGECTDKTGASEHEADRSDRIPRVAMIARWKPLHIGQYAVLDALTARAEHLVIGIGSSNRYNARNPFTANETADMIRAALASLDRDNASILDVPDLDDGPRWRLMVIDMLGPLDVFVTANGYVRSLLMHDYEVVHPVRFVSPSMRVRVNGSSVREAMAKGEGWRELVPRCIEELLSARGLVDRFRAEFGAETLASVGKVRESLTG